MRKKGGRLGIFTCLLGTLFSTNSKLIYSKTMAFYLKCCAYSKYPPPPPPPPTHPLTHIPIPSFDCPKDINTAHQADPRKEQMQCCREHLFLLPPVSVAQLDTPSDWRPGGRGFNPHRSRQHSFVKIDHEIFSTVILSLPLIQELSVPGERICTILVNRLED